MISTLIFGLSIVYGCSSPVEEKQPVETKEIVPISGTENVKDKEADEVAELEDKGLSPDEIEKLNKLKEIVAENRPLIESQLQGVLNMHVKINSGDEVAIKKPSELVKDELLIKFKADISTQSIQAFVKEYNLEIIKEYLQIKVFLCNIRDERDVLSVCKKLNEDHLVEYAEPNFTVQENIIRNDHNM